MKNIIIVYFILTTFLFAIDARMEIIKKRSNIPKINIAISKESVDNKIVYKIKELIKKDLEVSGHFRNSKNITNTYSFNDSPVYLFLQKKNLDLFLNLKSDVDKFGHIIIHTKLYDINSNKLVLSKAYSSSSADRYPFLAHKISIEINKYLNAPSIKWMDKLIIFAKYLNSKQSEIVISDYTLTYQKSVVKGGLNIFPKWANLNQDAFYYTSYSGLLPVLKKQNLYTGKVRKIISSDGMVVNSDVSKISSKIILTLAPNSQPDIYVYDTKKKLKTRITKYKGIDVGGNFVENDTKIVFVSDRLKYPNIFAKKLGQKGVERLVYHGKNNSQSTTYNNYIVYASRESGNEFGRNVFNLYLISTQSDFIRRLTSNGRNQFPKFSEDGDSILYIKNKKGKSYLGIIRINYNKSFLFPLKVGKLQSIDW